MTITRLTPRCVNARPRGGTHRQRRRTILCTHASPGASPRNRAHRPECSHRRSSASIDAYTTPVPLFCALVLTCGVAALPVALPAAVDLCTHHIYHRSHALLHRRSSAWCRCSWRASRMPRRPVRAAARRRWRSCRTISGATLPTSRCSCRRGRCCACRRGSCRCDRNNTHPPTRQRTGEYAAGVGGG